MLWQEFERVSEFYGYERYLPMQVKCVLLDYEGNKQSEMKEKKYFKLADMQPIVEGNNIVWRINEGYNETFNKLPIE